MSFADLKKQSKLGSLTAKLVKEVEKMNTTNTGDERLWKLDVDKSGNGYAVIRFLPAPNGEDLPFVAVLPCLPRSWWLVHRELFDHSGSEGSRVRIQHHAVEQWHRSW